MLIYWTMFAVPALGALVGDRASNRRQVRIALGLLIVFLTVVVGFRYQVGTDWTNYEQLVEATRFETLLTAMSFGDPAYSLLSWISTHVGLGQLVPNFVCGSLLLFGIWRFARRQANSWLVIAAAVPYLVIVVGMGYVRQAAAIGLILIALNRLEDGAVKHCVKWIVLAALFHVTAVCILPLVALAVVRKNLWAAVPVFVVGAALYPLLFASRLETFSDTYVETDIESSGVLPRLVMGLASTLVFFAWRRRFLLSPLMRSFWTYIGLATIAAGLLVLFVPGSTIIDRVALYFIPLQLFVVGNSGSAVAATGRGRFMFDAMWLLAYASSMFVWLNYATHSVDWVPYRLYPLEELR